MLYRNLYDTTFLVFTTANLKCFIQRRNASKPKKDKEQLIRKRSEDKLLFGELLETKKEKVKRTKLDDKEIEKLTCSINDSEIAWMIKSSPNLKFFKRIGQNKYISFCKDQNKDVPKEIDKEKCRPRESPKKILSKQPDQNETDKIYKSDTNSNSNEEYKCETDQNVKIESKVTPNSSIQENLDSRWKQQSKNLDTYFRNVVREKQNRPLFFNESKSTMDEWKENSNMISISAFENKLSLNYPSVTKILSSTMSEESKQLLELWKQRMIDKLGLQGFEIYQSELLQEGKLFHAAIVATLIDKPFVLSDKTKPSLVSLSEVFKDIDKVRSIESYVVHPTLKYKGRIDCVANYRGELCLIDWKKSERKKPNLSSMFDAPYQLASYIGALNADYNYPFQIQKGLLIVAYNNGMTATVHEISRNYLEFYWEIWMQRLQEYELLLNQAK